MAVLINGNGNEAIYAQQDADWYAALMGGVTMITAVGEQFAYELLDANTIGVKDGVIITKEGRRIQVDTNVIDTFDIPTGAQGTTNYYIIGYHLVTDEQSVQTAETFVQLMENGTDTIPEGSFKEGDDDVFVSLYRVEQNDLTIGTLTLLLPTVSDSMQQQISTINADLTEVVASQIGAGTTTFTSTKNKLLIIVKKSNMIVQDLLIPVSALNNGDIINLGDKIPLYYTNSSFADRVFSFDQYTSGAFYVKGNGAVFSANTPNVQLHSKKSQTIGATMTYNGSGEYTITVSDSTLSVYVY